MVGGGGLLLAQKALHKTSDTAFCLSCTLMSRPFEEYQELSTFEPERDTCGCADCHIPKSGMDYLFAKLKASKIFIMNLLAANRQ
ncbi:NapC/NirT family cytochrome c [Escherichia coli]